MQQATTSPQLRTIAALQGFHGIGLLSAVTIVAEVGDLRRFAAASQLMTYRGPAAQRTLQRASPLADAANSSPIDGSRAAVRSGARGDDQVRPADVETLWWTNDRRTGGGAMGGQSDEVAGRIKAVAGEVTGAPDLEAEGKRQSLADDVKKVGESVKRKTDEIGDMIKR